MPITVPDNPKVYTTKYENFRGVDFTNDPTNVWYRRSPTGTNMLPDAAGTPFKRHGWEVLISNEDLCTALSENDCEITKTTWFELAGTDHIAIFTNRGVVFYNGLDDDPTQWIISKDQSCYTSYDRCFFFEGNGISAFYIYGNYKMWKYGYENDEFTFVDITDELYVPTIIDGANGDGAGDPAEAYNMLANKASIEYGDYDVLTHYGTDGLVFNFVESVWRANTSDFIPQSPMTYWWKYDGASWSWAAEYVPSRGKPPFPYDPDHEDQSAIIPANPKESDEIVVLYGKGLMLPNNVDIVTQGSDVEVYVTTASQFDTSVPIVVDISEYHKGNALLVQDVLSREYKQAHIEFHVSDTYNTGTDSTSPFYGMDTFKTIFPVTEVVVASESSSITGMATLIGEVV